MRHIKLFVLTLIILVLSVNTQAQEVGRNNFEFGTEVSYFDYEEPNFMEEDGILWGVFGNYSYLAHENSPHDSFADLFRGGNGFNSFELDARILFGEVDYTSASTGSVEGIDDYLFEIRGLTGYDLPVGQDSVITFFLGLGYRYLNDDSSGKRTTTGAAGYERESNYLYLPLGIGFATPLDESWSLSAQVEYDLFLTGKQKSHLEDAVVGLSTVENDQDDGWGVRGSVKIARKSERFDFFVEPYVRYWEVDDSEISPVTYSGVLVGFGLEPENKSLETGARVGFNF